MTQIDLEEWLTSSQGDTPASPSRLPGSDVAVKMTDISGQKCLGLSKLSGPAGSLEKMLLATSLWASTRCYLTWKAQATPAGATLFRLSPQMPDTDATESGLWPTAVAYDATPGGPNNHYKGLGHQAKHGGKLLHTPTAKANQMAPSMNSGWQGPEMWATPSAADSVGTTDGGQSKSLRTDVRMWPTPIASEAKTNKDIRPSGKSNSLTAAVMDQHKTWPTPTAHIHKEGGFPAEYTRNTPTLTAEATEADGKPHSSGSLNPEWVEWLMGYPVGYTDLNS